MSIRSSLVLGLSVLAGAASPTLSLDHAGCVQPGTNLAAVPSSLHQLAGHWTGSVDIGYEDGTNSSSNGSVSVRFEQGENSSTNLVLAYEGAARGVPFSGVQRLSFSGEDINAYAFDGRLNGTAKAAGTFVEAVNAVECKGQFTNASGGDKMPFRQILRVERENEVVLELYITRAGQEDLVLKYWLNRAVDGNKVAATNLLTDSTLLAKINVAGGQNTANVDSE
jgi:hypothetical protein